MGVNCWFVINKSGKSYDVHDLDNGNKVVGTIVNREAYIYYGSEGDHMGIVFLDPNGKFRSVTIDTGAYPMPANCSTFCTDYPYAVQGVDGARHYLFIMRNAMPIYYPDGSYWGSVAKGMRVATTNNKVGSSHTNWKEISYVERSTDHAWVKVEGKGFDVGYVDTGIASASGYKNIPFYGSW